MYLAKAFPDSAGKLILNALNPPKYTLIAGLSKDTRKDQGTDVKFQDFHIGRGKTRENSNAVYYMWADNYKKSQINASIIDNEYPYLKILFKNSFESWPCNIAIIPFDYQALENNPFKQYLVIAASQALELGIDAVLNLAREFPLTFPAESSIAYKQLGLLDGAQHPIPDKVILEAIAWIEKQLRQGKKNILINCRAGIGRSGSVSLAYCFYKHRNWSYQQTLDYIWSQKADIYPHSHLQESLERLFPREIN